MNYRTLDPLREFEAIRRDFERNFNVLTRGIPRAWFAQAGPAETAAAIPAITVRETDAAYLIDARLPGVDTAKLEVTYDQGRLTISGERPAVETPQESRPRIERWSGKFTRGLKLAGQIDPQKITAEYKNGILRVMAPKAEIAQPRRIEIKTA